MSDHFPSESEVRAERERRDRKKREARAAMKRKQADERARAVGGTVSDHFPSASEVRAERECRDRKKREARAAMKREQADKRSRAHNDKAAENARQAPLKQANLAVLDEFAAKAHELRIWPPLIGSSLWRRGFPVPGEMYLVVRRGRPRYWYTRKLVRFERDWRGDGEHTSYYRTRLDAPEFMAAPTENLRESLRRHLK